MNTVGRKLLSLVLVFSLMLGTFSGAVVFAADRTQEVVNQESKEKYSLEKQAKIELELHETPILLNSAPSGMLSTSYINCYIHENGIYNIGTVDGDCLLFAYPDGTTSQTLVRINSVDYLFSDYVTEITYASNGKSCVAKATIDGVLVTQTISIIKNPNTNTENVVSIHYNCKNNSTGSKTIGVRIMMDTMLGNNDGAPFKVGKTDITKEREYKGDSIPTVYQAMDSLSNPSLTATGYFYYTSGERPDKVQFAHWGSIYGSSWDFKVDTTRPLTNDSAVAAYFNEKTVAAGASRTAVTYYGAYDSNVASQYEKFDYTNNQYSQELAEICARYSAYAYEGYLYDASLDVFYDTEDEAEEDKDLFDRSTVLYEALKAEGYRDIDGYNYSHPSEDSATYTLAHKPVNYNNTVRELLLIVIRGTNDIEWLGNMNVTGKSYRNQDRHDSFQNGSDMIFESIPEYVNSQKLNNPIVLITGHSRGGAVGNLLAHALTNGGMTCIDRKAVFAYLFAVPNVTTEDTSGMNNVFNFCLTDDFVPSMPLPAWNYGKYGISFSASATEAEAEPNSEFVSRHIQSLKKSKLYSEERVSFDAARAASIIDHVGRTWGTVYDYYTQEPVGTTVVDSLYEFMHDVLAPAARATSPAQLAAGLRLLSFTNKNGSLIATATANSYTPIANFFTDGVGKRPSVNDTHQMYTYYNALRTGVFNTTSATTLSASNEVLASDGTACDTELVYNALTGFANTGNNLEILDWNLTDASTWTGITLNENGCVTEIDLSYLGLTGSLDLTGFDCLTYVNVSGNELVSLILPEPEISVLSWLNCGYNNLTELDVTGQLLELLVCDYNYLDVAVMEEMTAEIPMVSCKTQNTTEEIIYSENDVAILKERILTNSAVWDLTANPGSWIGVEWEKIDGIYYVTGLDLANGDLSGKLDVSGLAHLTYLKCSSNSITSIDATGCHDLTFLSCSNNAISEIRISDDAELEVLYCSDNYLTEEQIAALNAELTVSGHQGIQAEPDSFCEAELNVLIPVAERLEEDTAMPGEWLFVTWEKYDGIYHAAKLDFSGLDAIGDTLDLSRFEYLEEIDLSSTAIESVILPDHMDSINPYAFYDCDALVQIQLPDELTAIGEFAFFNCDSLETIIFPTGLKHIGESAFEDCGALQRVYFPAAVESVGDNAFRGNSGMEAAYFMGNAPTTGENVFMFTAVDFVVYYQTGTTGWDDEIWSSYILEEISQFSIMAYPDKLIYEIGETLDTTGLVLLLLNPDGVYQEITEGYTVGCASFDEPGDYTVLVQYGEHSVTYEVTVEYPNIANANFFMENSRFEYTGEEIQPEVTVAYGDKPLTESVDYELYYTENIGPGTAMIHIYGIGEYVGSAELNFEIYVDGPIIVSDWRELESSHNYSSNCDATWVYTVDDNTVIGLSITFDENTCLEWDCDSLKIYDAEDNLIGSYTNTELAGQTVEVPGNCVKLRLVTDGGITDWGFKVVDLQATGLYELSVVGGTGSGMYAAGTEVTVRAEETQCSQFAYWTSEGVELEDAAQAEITIVMPASDVTLTAAFEDPVHTSENGTVITAPTCTQTGTMLCICQLCGCEYTEEIPATGHNYEDGSCTVCGEEDPDYEASTVPSEPSKPGGWGSIWDWIFGGWWGNGDEEEACEHVYTSVVTDPTCTDKGYTTHTCDKCGDSYKDTYVNATGHNYVDNVCKHCGARKSTGWFDWFFKWFW